MKISHSHPVAQAALILAQATLDKTSAPTAYIFRTPADQLVFDLHAPGSLAISTSIMARNKMTLSAKAHFARPAVVNVKARDGRVMVGAKSHEFSESSKASPERDLLSSTSPKSLKAEAKK